MEEEPSDGVHKRSTIPDIPSVAEEIKEGGPAHIQVNKKESAERNIQTQADAVLPKHQAPNVLSPYSRVPELVKPVETIRVMESEPVKVIPSEYIPLEIKPTISRGSGRSRKIGEEAPDEDDTSGDFAVLPTREETRISNWSDEEEAGGLPRSDSRSSRMTRAVRQLFCCGVAYQPASEDDIPSTRAFSGI